MALHTAINSFNKIKICCVTDIILYKIKIAENYETVWIRRNQNNDIVVLR